MASYIAHMSATSWRSWGCPIITLALARLPLRRSSISRINSWHSHVFLCSTCPSKEGQLSFPWLWFPKRTSKGYLFIQKIENGNLPTGRGRGRHRKQRGHSKAHHFSWQLHLQSDEEGSKMDAPLNGSKMTITEWTVMTDDIWSRVHQKIQVPIRGRVELEAGNSRRFFFFLPLKRTYMYVQQQTNLLPDNKNTK